MATPALLYQDEHLLVVDKPSGLLVHRTPQAPDRDVLVTRLAAHLGRWVHPVHRLDRGTSGAVLFAFDAEGARRLQAALRAPDARKEYLTLVRGSVGGPFWVRRPLTAPSGERRPAWTELEPLADLPRSTLLLARLRTGRRHQIRRHLAHCAHHVLGDGRYGKGRINRAAREEVGLSRPFLHAWRLGIEHPWTGARLEVRAPLPDDLRAVLTRLGAPASLVTGL